MTPLEAGLAHAGAGAAQATLDALALPVCVLDERGTLVAVNAAWRSFATTAGPGACAGAGSSYADACRSALGAASGDSARLTQAFANVVAGRALVEEVEVALGHARGRWLARLVRADDAGSRRVVVTHEDITERRAAMERSIASGSLLRARLSRSEPGGGSLRTAQKTPSSEIAATKSLNSTGLTT